MQEIIERSLSPEQRIKDMDNQDKEPVMLKKASIQYVNPWIPAYAGMTMFVSHIRWNSHA